MLPKPCFFKPHSAPKGFIFPAGVRTLPTDGIVAVLILLLGV